MEDVQKGSRRDPHAPLVEGVWKMWKNNDVEDVEDVEDVGKED